MKITTALFEAHLKCPTKCWLRATGEPPSGNTYAEWVHGQEESYRADAVSRLRADRPANECIVQPPADTLKTAAWQLVLEVPVAFELRSSRGNEAQVSSPHSTLRVSQPNDQSLLTSAATIVETRLHAIERVPSAGRGKPAQFVPIRFIFRNKLTQDDRLLLAFDALVLSQVVGREVSLGKIIHGDDHATLNVKSGARTAESARTSVTSKGLMGEVRKRLDRIAALLSNPTPPDLVLNRHCAECEFQARCRKIAIEKDDLSLLARMSEKERKKLHSKGIFTVTQLSYTFRPRRRPKKLRDKREKYHHSLKALAIREKKIHIVGSPELKIEGTPVYLDVEGLPDRDFYYLIGVRIGNGESAAQHSLWADTVEDEGKIWREFLAILETVEKPVLIHYGSYETTFLNRMCKRYLSVAENPALPGKVTKEAVNLVALMYGQLYFPTPSNGLKDIAGWFGFKWSEDCPSGTQTIRWRHAWEISTDLKSKEKLITYNFEDCWALQEIATQVLRIWSGKNCITSDVVSADAVPQSGTLWRPFSSPISAFETINKAAKWDYQRDRVYVRTDKKLRVVAAKRQIPLRRTVRPNAEIVCQNSSACPRCNRSADLAYAGPRVLHDLRFSSRGIRRWIVRYHVRVFHCRSCRFSFGKPKEFWGTTKYGYGVVTVIVYSVIHLCMVQQAICESLNAFVKLGICDAAVNRLKASAAEVYEETRERILARLVAGRLIHADETRIILKSSTAYVWVFTSLHEVVFFYAETREGNLLRESLKGFKGVLVSDFYAAYDAMPCAQQKCLIHLMRDLNETVLAHPYDQEVKTIATGFADLLQAIVETIDRRGLKRHFLRKHRREVQQFFGILQRTAWQSEPALRCKERFEKNRDKLFTFLEYDDVPWNNNNAEHAIKAFAKLRRAIVGLSTPKGIEEYLVLLSICQTCKYMGVDFLDFLRSGEKDIHAFAESRRGRRRLTQSSQPTGLPADAIPNSGPRTLPADTSVEE